VIQSHPEIVGRSLDHHRGLEARFAHVVLSNRVDDTHEQRFVNRVVGERLRSMSGNSLRTIDRYPDRERASASRRGSQQIG
jgi:hypothetical protein